MLYSINFLNLILKSFLILGIPSEFFIIKILIICLFAIAVRGTVPRYRFDQATMLNWKHFIFLWLCFLMFVICVNFLLDVYFENIFISDTLDEDSETFDVNLDLDLGLDLDTILLYFYENIDLLTDFFEELPDSTN